MVSFDDYLALRPGSDAWLEYVHANGLQALRLLRSDPHDAAANPTVFEVAQAYLDHYVTAKYAGGGLPHPLGSCGAGILPSSFFDSQDDIDPAKEVAQWTNSPKTEAQLAAYAQVAGSDAVTANWDAKTGGVTYESPDLKAQLKDQVGDKLKDAASGMLDGLSDQYSDMAQRLGVPAEENWDQWYVDSCLLEGTDSPNNTHLPRV